MKAQLKIKGSPKKWVKPQLVNLNNPVKTQTKSSGCLSCNRNKNK